MVCILNLYHSLTILSVILLIWYICVCLPDNSLITRFLISILASFMVIGIIAGFANDYLPTAPLTFGSTIFGLMLGFLFLAHSLSDLLLICLAIIVTGPLLLAARDHIEQWFIYQFDWHIGQLGVVILCISVLIFAIIAVLYLRQNKFIWDIIKCILFSLFAIFAIRFLVIVVDYNNPEQLCCSGSSPDTCPVAFASIYWIFWIFLIMFRLLLLYNWRDLEKKVKEKYKHCWCCCICCCKKWRKKQIQQTKEEGGEKEPLINKDQEKQQQ